VRTHLQGVQLAGGHRRDLGVRAADRPEHVQGGDHVDIGRVQAFPRDAVVRTQVAEPPLAAPVPVQVPVEHQRVDDGQRGAAKPLGHAAQPVPPQLRVEQAQVEARVVGDDRLAAQRSPGERRGDLFQRRGWRTPECPSVLGRDPVDRRRALRDLDAGVDQPAAHGGPERVPTDQGRGDHPISRDVHAGGLRVEADHRAVRPAHRATSLIGSVPGRADTDGDGTPVACAP
jgi:hypothetical protein